MSRSTIDSFDPSIAPGTATISHGLENLVSDFDLCGASCPTLTAGIWIGHGSNAFTPGSSGSGNSCTGNSVQGGGGDSTIVTGNGVSFKFDAGSAGFVSTHEVAHIDLSAPGMGAAQGTAGVPLLFLTTRTDHWFAWTIQPSLTACFLGSAYWASCVLELRAARQSR